MFVPAHAPRACAAAVTLLAISVSACSPYGWRDAQRPAYYTVAPGDTLYAIAWQHGVDYRELARWNGLADPARIYPGQRLVLRPPGAGSGASPVPRAGGGTDSVARTGPRPAQTQGPVPPAAPRKAPESDIAWVWPASGAVVATFGDRASLGKGIDIGGRSGDPVFAAADGRVVYSGSGLIGYGKLIIIKHNDTYLSAYGHNKTLMVRQGDDVSAGQRVAEMGEGPGQRPVLHFEIRLNGEPVDPLRFLPRR